jgi:hypothetical protein
VDYIVIQDNQRYYCNSTGKIDSFGYPAQVLSNNLIFQDSIKKIHPCTKIIYFAGWEQKGGLPKLFPGDNTIKLIKRIAANYKYMNDQAGVHNIIAPIGAAWISAMVKRPYLVKSSSDSFLYVADDRHPGAAGSYLAACVLFATIFHRSPVNLSEDYMYVTPELKTFLQQTAWQTVQDSFAYSNLGSVAPVVKSEGNTIYTSKGYASYQWYSGNLKIAGETTYKTSLRSFGADYWVETTNEKGCHFRSFPLKK